MLSKLIKFFLNRFSEEFRIKLIRALVRVPSEPNGNFVVKVADTEEELEAAFRLLHDCYSGQKLMEKRPDGLRTTVYSFLPETSTIIAKLDGEVVGTLSVIRDNRMGLPSDKDYARENQKKRQEGFKLVEISALGIRKDFRKSNHSISFFLMNYIYHYIRMLDADCMVVTLHPRAKEFYKALFGFHQMGRVIQYKFVNGAKAALLHFEDTTENIFKLVSTYKTDNLKKNLVLWILTAKPKCLVYPTRTEGQVLDPVWSVDKLRYFLFDKYAVGDYLTNHEKQYLLEAYHFYFDSSAISDFEAKFSSSKPKREFRTLTNLQASLVWGDEFSVVRVLDINSSGAFIDFASPKRPEPGTVVNLAFKLGRKSFLKTGLVKWVNQKIEGHLPEGFGVQFETNDLVLHREIQSIYFKKARKSA